MNWTFVYKQARYYREIRRRAQGQLSAKTRLARAFGFKPGDMAMVTCPEIRNLPQWGGQVVNYGLNHSLDEETTLVMLVKRLTLKENLLLFASTKYHWKDNPSPFFKQHLWLAISEEEITLAMEGFLTLERRNTHE